VYKFQHIEGGEVYGLFAKADIPPYSILGQYTGVVHCDDENQNLAEHDWYV
jgi:hypothetical protein